MQAADALSMLANVLQLNPGLEAVASAANVKHAFVTKNNSCPLRLSLQ
jgi:hypothetical protein